MTAIELKSALASLAVCWATDESLVDGEDPKARAGLVNMATANVLASCGNQLGLTVDDVALIVRDYFDGEEDDYLELLGIT